MPDIDITSQTATDKNSVEHTQDKTVVEENDALNELLQQLQKNQDITSSAPTFENMQMHRVDEAIKLQQNKANLGVSVSNQSDTLPILKGLSETQINRISYLTQKQTELQNKSNALMSKGQRLEAKAERLENTSQMLKSLFPDKPLPKPLQMIADKVEKKATIIRDEKIPKNNRRIDKVLNKMSKNDRKIEAAQCKVDKYQSLSKVIKSFAVLDSQERRQQFTQGMDSMRNASQRSMQMKMDKCEAKLEKLTQKYMDTDVMSKVDILAQLKAQTELINQLSEKIEKLQAMEKPFAEQPDTVVDSILDTAQQKTVQIDNELSDKDIDVTADEICVACAEQVVEKQNVHEKYGIITEKGDELSSKSVEIKSGDQLWDDKYSIFSFDGKFYSVYECGYTEAANECNEIDMDIAYKTVKEHSQVTEKGKAFLSEVENKDKEHSTQSPKRKSSVLDDIKEIKTEQAKEPKTVPEQGQKKARSNTAEIS